jgi:hypothetical protein
MGVQSSTIDRYASFSLEKVKDPYKRQEWVSSIFDALTGKHAVKHADQSSDDTFVVREEVVPEAQLGWFAWGARKVLGVEHKRSVTRDGENAELVNSGFVALEVCDNPDQQTAACTSRSVILLPRPYFGIKHMNAHVSQSRNLDSIVTFDTNTRNTIAAEFPSEYAIVSYDAQISPGSRLIKPKINVFWHHRAGEDSTFIESVKTVVSTLVTSTDVTELGPSPSPSPSPSRSPSPSPGRSHSPSPGRSHSPSPSPSPRSGSSPNPDRSPSSYTGKDWVRTDLVFRHQKNRDILNDLFNAVLSLRTAKQDSTSPIARDLWRRMFPKTGGRIPSAFAKRNVLFYWDPHRMVDAEKNFFLLAFDVALNGGIITQDVADAFSRMTARDLKRAFGAVDDSDKLDRISRLLGRVVSMHS